MGEIKKERKRKIVEEASKLFAKYGSKKTSLEDIAEATGLVKTSLYYYFKSKEELFQAVIKHEREILIDSLQKEIGNNSSPLKKLQVYVIKRINGIKELVNLYKLAMGSAKESMPLIEKERRQFFRIEKELVLDILNEGIQQKTFHIGNPERVAIVIIATLRGLESTIRLYDARQFDSADLDSILNIFLYGIVLA
ncbi:MAG: TetR/AcrR family transcriptional regulator [Deltaproteobacteria bacterium]|nr:TetR/AcrR family transcriptional regulator [Deltaproteobacteria bacterium]